MYLIPLSDEPLQSQNFTHEDYDLTMTTRWNTIFSIWQFDLYDNIEQEWITQSEGLSLASPALYSSSVPFFFVMLDDYGLIDEPVSKEDLGERVNVYIVNEEDYRDAIRQSVSINYR